MSEYGVVPVDDEPQEAPDKFEVRLDETRNIRQRFIQRLEMLLDSEFKDFERNPGVDNKAIVDVENVDRIGKLLLKSLGDNDKVDLTLKRISADQAMNDSALKTAQALTETMLRRLGQIDEHPLAAGAVYDGEVVKSVTPEERDRRLGFASLEEFNSKEFSPGVLIQGRVEETSDAFYARMAQLTESVREEVSQKMAADHQSSEASHEEE
ncbi:hypothetical protein N5V64_18880 [Escherichia coli]|uniref:hypothetical protein n=1 Tax=Escherichia coli TaxID=562 RepID=UPI0021B67DB3|nr:hypothetical protein [Escherichia coli]MCT7382311.1 hypothetical protein [Escherichia coli]